MTTLEHIIPNFEQCNMRKPFNCSNTVISRNCYNYIVDIAAGWTILTYENSRGENPVDEFIKKQQPKGRSKIIHNVRLLRQYGNMLNMPHSKALGGGLYELRIRGKEEVRIFYCFAKQRTIYLLHAFKKQKQQTPRRELELASLRMSELTKI